MYNSCSLSKTYPHGRPALIPEHLYQSNNWSKYSPPSCVRPYCVCLLLVLLLLSRTQFYSPSAPSLGVLKGVLRTVFGVAVTWVRGVTPLKSDSCRGVFSPPFKGVSTLVRAMMFWASCVQHVTSLLLSVFSERVAHYSTSPQVAMFITGQCAPISFP